MQDGIFKRGKRTQRTGYISTSTFIIGTRIYSQGSHAIFRREAKAIQPNMITMYSYLYRSTWQTAPQHSLKSKGMATPKDEGGRQGPRTFITQDLEDRTGPARPWQVTCPPSVVGESRRPVPTAASVATPDPEPLAWAASSLQRSSHGLFRSPIP